MVLNHLGYLGINTDNPTEFLHVNGRIRIQSIVFPDGSIQTSAPTTPVFGGGGIGITSSDIRIKKDIDNIDDNIGLNKILLIEPKTYKYIDETKGTHTVIGFIAQQIREVIEEAVVIGVGTLPNGEEVDDFNYLNKSYIFTLNVAATQQLHRMIIKQQTIIDGLISRIEALENS